MKIVCPGCSALVPAVNVNLNSGWGKCDACQEVFPLQEALPGFRILDSAAPQLERPYNARAILERTADELLIHVPAEGLRAATLGMLAFALLWLGLTSPFAFASLIVFQAPQQQPGNWLVPVLLIPFWLVGVGVLGKVVWKACGTRAITVTQDELVTIYRCGLWHLSRRFDLDQVQHARSYDSYIPSQGASPFSVEIVYDKGSFVFPADSEAEEVWLITEFNQFLHAQKTAGKMG